jgi:hypothetical protein
MAERKAYRSGGASEGRFRKKHGKSSEMRESKITIPTGVTPHVRFLFEEMRRQAVMYEEMEERSGVLRSTLKAWRFRNVPSLTSIEACLGVLGWTLVQVPNERVLPPALVADLKTLAARHDFEMEDTIEALIEVVTRIHERDLSSPDEDSSYRRGFEAGFREGRNAEYVSRVNARHATEAAAKLEAVA